MEWNGIQLGKNCVYGPDYKHLLSDMYIEVCCFIHIDCGAKEVLKVCDNLVVMELSFPGTTANIS